MESAGVYVRVSSEDQVLNGVSLDMQGARLRAYCEARGWAVHKLYLDDGVSGRVPPTARPGLAGALKDAKARRFQHLVVFKLDRLSRSVLDLLQTVRLLKTWKVGLSSLSEVIDSETANGRMMLNLLATLAEWEAAVAGERTAAALRHKREKGMVYGPLPLGFRREGGMLQPMGGELATVRRIFELRGRPLRAIADTLRRERRRTKAGGRWASETVRKVLRNEELYRPYLSAGAE